MYLPHLDYNLQRRGIDFEHIAGDLQEVDEVCRDLISYYEAQGTQVILLSEYGITSVSRPVHLNRVLREAGYITVKEELGRELLDAGVSRAFAVADHQLAHVYVNEPDALNAVKQWLEATPGVAQVLDEAGKEKYHLDHERAGELVAIAEPDAWFTYYYWLDDERAPDFARTVDIHRKPGYDPVETIADPDIRFLKAKVGSKILRKKLGFRYLMDVIPLDATLVKGSHGAIDLPTEDRPLLVSQSADLLPDTTVAPINVIDVILAHLTSDET